MNKRIWQGLGLCLMLGAACLLVVGEAAWGQAKGQGGQKQQPAPQPPAPPPAPKQPAPKQPQPQPQPANNRQTPQTPSTETPINWRSDNIGNAINLARKEAKPLFLYIYFKDKEDFL